MTNTVKYNKKIPFPPESTTGIYIRIYIIGIFYISIIILFYTFY